MVEKIKRVTNPLTIIAIFAALSEVAGTAALAVVEKELQLIFIWFVMLFPILLVGLFFYTLHKNSNVFYAPSDFREDKSYLALNQEIENMKELTPVISTETEASAQDSEIKETTITQVIQKTNIKTLKFLKAIKDTSITTLESQVQEFMAAFEMSISKYLDDNISYNYAKALRKGISVGILFSLSGILLDWNSEGKIIISEDVLNKIESRLNP